MEKIETSGRIVKDKDATILDSLLTPEEIARRITTSSSVHVSARIVWEKARRIGVAKKIGRSPLISAEDIPLLLQEEKSKSPVNSGRAALAMLQRSRRKRLNREEG